MQRLHSVNPELAQGRTKELFETVEQAFGIIPNTVRVMANSPAVLDSFLSFAAAMGGAKIGEKLYNQVKLKTSEANSCDYCTSILCAIGPSAGLSADDLLAGRTGRSKDHRTEAALNFAEAVLENRGKVSDDQLVAVRKEGYGDAEIVEIVASVVLGCFTNFLNKVANTELDVPEAEPVEACTTSTCNTEVCSSR